MYRALSLVFFLFLAFGGLISMAGAEVYLGYTAGLQPKVPLSEKVKLPVFIKFPNSPVRAWVERDFADGTKAYCDLEKEEGELLMQLHCSWKSQEVHYDLSPPPAYLMFFLSWQEQAEASYTLRVCLQPEGGETECGSLQITPLNEAASTSEETDEAGMKESTSHDNDTDQCVWDGDPHSAGCAEENHASNQETNSLNSNPFLGVGHNSGSSSTNYFLEHTLNHNSRPSVTQTQVWNGYVEGGEETSPRPSAGGQQEPSCNPEERKLSTSSINYTLRTGEDRTFGIFLQNDCGEKICDVSWEGNVAEDWLKVVPQEDGRGCKYLQIEITAPEDQGNYYTTLEIVADNETYSLPVSLRVIPEATAGAALYMDPEKFYNVNISPKSVYHVYFYGCDGPGGFRNRISFSVEESSHYHQGAIEPIIRFVGDHVPTEDDYPTWDDYENIKDYVYASGTIHNYCPHSYDAYYAEWSDWYGHVNSIYSDYYYCLGGVLTRYLDIYSPSEGERKCGWWAVSLFNNRDERRDYVRLWVEVADHKN